MRLALAGLRASGKSTLFGAVTGAHARTPRQRGASAADIGQVQVPDERLDRLAAIVRPKKVTHATIDFLDVVGLSADSSSGAAFNSRVLAQMREVDGLVIVLRAFRSDSVAHPLGSLDPVRDLRVVREELLLADTLIAEKSVEKLRAEVTKPKPGVEDDKRRLAVQERCLAAFEKGIPAREIGLSEDELHVVSGFQFLTLRPILAVVNVDEEDIGEPVEIDAGVPVVSLCARIEAELALLEGPDREELARGFGLMEPAGLRLARASYRALDTVTFLTANEKEARAWTIPRGSTALAAAAKVHTDIARGFIRAEVVAFDDLAECGSFREVRAKGKGRLEGKNYVVRDADVIEFRFSPAR